MSNESEALDYSYNADHEDHPHNHKLESKVMRVENIADPGPESAGYISLPEDESRKDYGDIEADEAFPILPEPLGVQPDVIQTPNEQVFEAIQSQLANRHLQRNYNSETKMLAHQNRHLKRKF